MEFYYRTTFKTKYEKFSHELEMIRQHIRCNKPKFGQLYNLAIVINHLLAKEESECK